MYLFRGIQFHPDTMKIESVEAQGRVTPVQRPPVPGLSSCNSSSREPHSEGRRSPP